MALGGASRPRGTRSHVVETSEPAADLSDNLTCQEKMRVVVIATTPKSTVAALRTATCLATDLGAQITLLATESVPRQFPLQKPPVPVAFLERKLCGLIYEAGIMGKEVLIQLYLCRHQCEGLRTILRPHSLVIIGGHNGWWSRRERNLKEFLTSLGHRVIFAEDGPDSGFDRTDKACQGYSFSRRNRSAA